MDLSVITMKDLMYLCRLAETGHFGKAAQLCHVTQPSLSIQVKKIEDVLGVQIFERTNRSVSVTEIGRQIVDQAQNVLDQCELLSNIAQKDKSVLSGPFRLGLIHTIGPYFVPCFIQEIKKKYPDLKLTLVEGKTEDLLEKLDKNKLDAVLASKNFETSKYGTFSLFFEPFVLMISKENELSNQREVDVNQLDFDEMIFLETGNCLTDDVKRVCQFQEKNKSLNLSATSIETLRYLVSYYNSYALIPKSSILRSENLDRIIEYKNIRQSKIGREVILIARKSYPFSKNLKSLKDFFKKMYINSGL